MKSHFERYLFCTAFLFSHTAVRGIPATIKRQDSSSDNITTLSQPQISVFKPFTYYAAAARCSPNTTANWTCGSNCEANPTFEPVAAGGDGDLVQYWYVGYDPTLETIIVAHQGTNTSEILPLLTDVDIIMEDLNATAFPGVPSDVQVHSGFMEAQARAAPQVLSAVQTAITRYNTTNATIIGHSLGAAIALLDAVYLPLHVTTPLTYRTVTYGMPRVGNQAFANYVDANVTALTHINNKEDPIPVVPPLLLGYHHPSGEVHINDNGTWNECPGQDNPSVLCSTGDVSDFLIDGNTDDHDGPYDGVEIMCNSTTT